MFKDLEIVYKENNNKSYFHIPQLGLIASGDNIEEARKNLQIEYEKYKKKSVEADINIDESNSNKESSSGTLNLQSNFFNEFLIFGGKYLIVLITIVFVIIFIGSKVDNQISKLKQDLSIDQLVSKIEEVPNKLIQSIENIQVGESPLKKIEKELERAARDENQIPEEKKKEIIKNINTVVDRNKPFVDAIGRLFE